MTTLRSEIAYRLSVRDKHLYRVNPNEQKSLVRRKLTVDKSVIDNLILVVLEVAHSTNPGRCNAALLDRATVGTLGERFRLTNSNVTTIVVIVATRNVRLVIGFESAVVVVRAVDGGVASGAAGGWLLFIRRLNLSTRIDFVAPS
jgi:hypothetical protein